jgi:hypothetical protein
MRATMAIVLGIVLGFVTMLAVALLGGLLFPSDARIDSVSAEQLVAVFPTIPMGAKIAIILSWFAGALVGAMIAKRIAGRGWAAWTITAIFAVYVLLTVLVLPMPGWLQVVAVVAPLIGGLLANHLVDERFELAGDGVDLVDEPGTDVETDA